MRGFFVSDWEIMGMAGGAAWLKDFPGKRGENALVEVVLMGSVSPSGGGRTSSNAMQCVFRTGRLPQPCCSPNGSAGWSRVPRQDGAGACTPSPASAPWHQGIHCELCLAAAMYRKQIN